MLLEYRELMSTPTQRESKPFAGGFDYQIDPAQYGAASSNYYWWRKRQKVFSLAAKAFGSLPQNAIVVDLGCGDATDLFLLWRQFFRPGMSFYGLDGDPDHITLCNIKREYYNATGVAFTQVDVTAGLPFEGNSVDLVYCSEVLEHLPDPDNFLAEISRIIKPAGYLLASTPNEPNIFQRSYWNKGRKRAATLHSEVTQDDGTPIPLYGHISLRRISEWDKAIRAKGLELSACERGALFYQISNGEAPFALQLLAEYALDFLPVRWTRNISDQLIGLYQKLI